MSEFVLNADVRENTGKHARRVRRAGMIPGVYYAQGEESLNIQVPGLGLDPLIYTSETHVIELRLKDGTAKRCILRDVQYDPVTDQPVHFDLQGLKENERLTIEVPIVLTGGTPHGVREGGILQHMIHRLRIACLPKDIPEKIEINVGELAINHSVHVRDLTVPNVTVLENADAAVVGILPPTLTKEAETPVVTEEAPKEPELVGKGKKAEEGEGEESAKAEAETKPAAKEEKKEKK
jgi:large subunit ribosomal protein L25